ncbi:hypothetical protein [Agaribacterium haliotis]|uniref:hypothetical protein n=1 Tax=Agaribacterium haliotis TaxID=2013869 RepID=UPI001177AFDB|nr:hypothetical protein [Agaribacterium haliotis]
MKIQILFRSWAPALVVAALTSPFLQQAHAQTAPTQPAYQQGEAIPALAYVEHGEIYNPEAPIPPQCYTKTDGVHNPCYVCHQTYSDEQRTNMMHDGFQQGSYAFSEAGETNSWSNLFKDRRQAIAEVSDEEILEYVREDNYSELIRWMKSDQWQGVVPEINNLASGAAAFDKYGLALDGSRWVAFNYKPLPSTFWPTNGSSDDTMIRLAPAFSEQNGEFNRDLYYANLSLLELAISGLQSIDTPELDETKLGADLDGDGELSISTHIQRRDNYLGDASAIALSHMLYPQGTEFLHTVRYIDVDEQGNTSPAARMKEVRYMVKKSFKPRNALVNRYYGEFKEKHFENLPSAVDKKHKGISNNFGWLLLGFIEDEQGQLRKQHREEQFACVGCHKAIGSTIDQTFGFPRKVAGAKGWAYIDLKSIKDVPNIGEKQGEFLTYLERVGGGDEFRQNDEMLERWFDSKGQVNKAAVLSTKSIYELISPSRERALALNKAYREVVKEQSYLYGRDAVLAPATNVLKQVNTEQAPLKPEHRYQWDIRLNWQEAEAVISDADSSL